MSASGTVVAVNRDRGARIFDYSSEWFRAEAAFVTRPRPDDAKGGAKTYW